MKIPEEIKRKIKEFLLYIEESTNIKSDDAINKFKELFEGEYIEDEINVNEVYYQSSTKNYYLKSGYGITLQINSGDWDRYGSSVSHIGKDIVLYSVFSKIEKYRNGYELFFEDEKLIKKLPKNIYEVFNIDLSKESLVNSLKNNKYLNSVYKILPNELKNDKKFVFERYMHLKEIAIRQHKEEEHEAYESPYHYVSVNSIEKILMNYIETFGDNEYFRNRAFALFDFEFGYYLNKQIEKCEKALYIIDNKDEYLKLFDLKYELETDEEYIKYLEETISDTHNNLEVYIDEYNNLKNKKYTLLERIKSIPKQDEEKMMKLGDSDMKCGTIELLQAELTEWQSNYMEYKSTYNELKNKYDELKEKLKVPFKDYSEAYKWEDYEKGWEKVSLNLLLEKKNSFAEQLGILQNKKKCAEDFKEYAKSFLQNNNELVEEDCMEM